MELAYLFVIFKWCWNTVIVEVNKNNSSNKHQNIFLDFKERKLSDNILSFKVWYFIRLKLIVPRKNFYIFNKFYNFYKNLAHDNFVHGKNMSNFA